MSASLKDCRDHLPLADWILHRILFPMVAVIGALAGSILLLELMLRLLPVTRAMGAMPVDAQNL